MFYDYIIIISNGKIQQKPQIIHIYIEIIILILMYIIAVLFI